MSHPRFVEELLRQPETLGTAIPKFAPDSLAWISQSIRSGRIDRIVMTGMGASHYGTYPAWLILAQHGHPAYWVETAELLHYAMELIKPKTLLWITSQSGRSAEVHSLLELLGQGRGATILAVTNETDSPLAERADFVMPLYAGEELTVSTCTYLNTLAATQLTALEAVGIPIAQGKDDLLATAHSISQYLESWESRVNLLRSTARGMGHLIALGRGSSYATAMVGALILKEAAKIDAEGMSAGQFRHGPLELAGPGLTVLVLESPPQTSDLDRRLARSLLANGTDCYWGSSTHDDELPTLMIPSSSGIGRPAAEITLFQLLSVAICQEVGISPGVLLRSGKVTLEE
jgi:glucosamine--fructose-6-phosphate aminotransferase (isomerizing)